MKKQIISLIATAAVFAASPAFAMTDETDDSAIPTKSLASDIDPSFLELVKSNSSRIAKIKEKIEEYEQKQEAQEKKWEEAKKNGIVPRGRGRGGMMAAKRDLVGSEDYVRAIKFSKEKITELNNYDGVMFGRECRAEYLGAIETYGKKYLLEENNFTLESVRVYLPYYPTDPAGVDAYYKSEKGNEVRLRCRKLMFGGNFRGPTETTDAYMLFTPTSEDWAFFKQNPVKAVGN